MAAVTEHSVELEVHTSEDVRPRAWRRLKELYRHREILMNLIRKEIKDYIVAVVPKNPIKSHASDGQAGAI